MSLKTLLGGPQILLKFDNWPTLLLSRLLDRETGLVVYRKDGLEVLVDHRGGDQNGTRACLATDMYQRHLHTIYRGGAQRVLDLGANGGGFPLLLRLANVELAQVVCVEMNHPTYLRLLVNLATNLGENATGINAAVSSMPADSEILLEPGRGGTSLSINRNRADSARPHVTVRTTTLQALYDQYFKGRAIDICKIDIEGAEYEVLHSSSDVLLQKIRNLVIEFHDPAQTPACIDRLLGLGFADATGPQDAGTSEKTEVRVFCRN
jgi:FkbM family methyltransferase